MGRILQVEQRMLLARRCEFCRTNDIELITEGNSIGIKCKKCGSHFICGYEKPEDKVTAFERVTEKWNETMRNKSNNTNGKLQVSSLYGEFKR